MIGGRVHGSEIKERTPQPSSKYLDFLLVTASAGITSHSREEAPKRPPVDNLWRHQTASNEQPTINRCGQGIRRNDGNELHYSDLLRTASMDETKFPRGQFTPRFTSSPRPLVHTPSAKVSRVSVHTKESANSRAIYLHSPCLLDAAAYLPFETLGSVHT